VDARLVHAPVEAVFPARHESAQVLEARTGRPGFQRRLVRKARAREALAQIAEQCFRNMKIEGADMGNCAAIYSARLDASCAPREHLARAYFASVHLQKLQRAIERTDLRAGARRVLLLPLRELRDQEPDSAHRPDAEPAGPPA